MPLLKLEIELTDATLQHIDQLRGEYERTEFMARCIELGVADYADEATRVYREALYMTMLNRTKDYVGARELRTMKVREAQAELNLQGAPASGQGTSLNFQGSSRRMTTA